MPRIELYITTSVVDEEGRIQALDDMAACFVKNKKSNAEVQETAMEFLAVHCETLSDLGCDVQYCVGIVYVDSEPIMSLSYISDDVSENVVPLHSPDWERLH